MTTYIWSILGMVTLPDVNGEVNYVWNVLWQCEATYAGKTKAMNSSVVLDPEATPNPYIPYEQLTQAQVVQWVKDKLGPVTVDKIQAQLTAELQSNVLPLPWSV